MNTKKSKRERMLEKARAWYSDPSYSMSNVYGSDAEKFFLGDEADDDEDEQQSDFSVSDEGTLDGSETDSAFPHLEFDGKFFKWMEDGKIVNAWPAMSGRADYQRKAYQWRPNEGPLPEGTYDVRQGDFQSFDDMSMKDKLISYAGTPATAVGFPVGRWPGARASWGNHRVWLQPDAQTNTYGRNNFSIHGGYEPGSSGCIDLVDKMDDFASQYRDYGKDMKLRVKYPNYMW